MSRLSIVMLLREFHPLTGGYQNQALRLARELVRRDVQVSVVTQRRPGLARAEQLDGIRIHRVDAWPRGHLAAWTYLLSALAWMAVHRDRFDVIHAHRSSSGLVAGLIGWLLRKPVVCKLTRGDEIEAKSLGRGVLGRAKLACLRRTVHRCVAITEPIAAELRQLGVPAERIVHIENGIDVDVPADPSRRGGGPAWGWPPDALVVTFVGRLVPAKGVDWLLRTWPHVLTAHPRARLLVVGDGAERAALERLAASLEVAGTVVFTGPRHDIGALLAGSDVFVLPSRLEGVSNALLEAMGAGLPIVAGDDTLGGNRSVVRDGHEGYLVRPDDRAALARALGLLLADARRRRLMGVLGRRAVEARFSMRSVAARYCAVYQDLTAGRRSA
jgi:glycosyltransferase involved in cell wall biosynthesis